MAKTPPLEVRCSFYARIKASDTPTYRYEHITLDGYDPDPLYTTHPPAVGDLLYLQHRHATDAEDLTGGYVVIARSWHFMQYRSGVWRYGEPHPDEGPMLHIIVEAAKGPFLDEEPGGDDG